MLVGFIGANSPRSSRIWRNPAHFTRQLKTRYESGAASCECGLTAAVPQVYPVAVYHFRTPSPGGQHAFHDVMLPVFFFARSRDRSVPHGRQIRARMARFGRRFAQVGAVVMEPLISNPVGLISTGIDTGDGSCGPKHLLWPLLPFLALRPVATPRVNRPSSAAPLAQVRQPSPVAVLYPARPSVQAPTCLPANSTSPIANTLTRPVVRTSIYCTHRPATRQGGVLRFRPRTTSEAPCSRSF